MATSRRTQSASGRSASKSSSRNPSRAPESVDPAEAPDAEESTSGSSRRSAASGRKSRRIQAQSSAKTPAHKGVLSPEERAARAKAVKSFFMLIIGIVVFLGAIGGGWYTFIRESPLKREAEAILTDGEAKLNVIETTIKNRQPRDARSAFNEGLKNLAVPMLGNAKEPIDEHDPNLSSKKQAYRAVELAKKIREYEPRIDKLERDLKAEANHRQVMEGFRKLSELDDAALAEHEKNAELFLKNPVGESIGAADDYSGLVQEVKSQMERIGQDRARRLASITTDQETLAHGEVRALVKEERFQDALNKIAEFKEKFPQAKFDHLRSFVEDSAKQAWEGVEKYAESRYTDYRSPGIPKAIGEQALREARTRLQQVIDKFGMETYISQAKALLDKYPTP